MRASAVRTVRPVWTAAGAHLRERREERVEVSGRIGHPPTIPPAEAYMSLDMRHACMSHCMYLHIDMQWSSRKARR